MEQRRFVVFVVLSIAILIGNGLVWSWLRGKQPPQVAQQKQNEPAEKKEALEKPAEQAPGRDKPADENKQPEEVEHNAQVAAADAAEIPTERISIGSADPNEQTNPHRLLVTLINRGAAVERIELAGAQYRDMEERGGYLGHLDCDDAPGGAQINFVGSGTPAFKAGFLPGDILTSLDDQTVTNTDALVSALSKTKPGQKISLTFERGGQRQTVQVELARYPLEVVRPELLAPGKLIPEPVSGAADKHDPFSFLMTLAQVDTEKLGDKATLETELRGVKLRTATWKVNKIDDETVEFTYALPKFGLEAIKRYHLDKAAAGKPGYGLTLEVGLRNTGTDARQVAYQLDGPTGLPIEGWWYATRISPDSGGAGVRDTVLKIQDKSFTMMSPMQIGDGKLDPPYRFEEHGSLLIFAGVDAQYFSCALMPDPQQDRPPWLAQIKPILVGELPKDRSYHTLGNVSCRLVSVAERIEPGMTALHRYNIFAGPKKPELLAQYPADPVPGNTLGELIYYGWPIWAMVAVPMTHILHFFYAIVGNYGIAIVMLTVLVRGCMFPLSRKQALGAQKMQALKPELDRINEKYKGKSEEKARAMQELYRKHGFNPMSGCLLALLQLPIFIGLYRSLMINIELRQAPLLSDAVRWCSNLAAPDMLFHWVDWPFMPSFLTAYKGFGSLGPYLNILPIFTVGLFIVQQQMFMPPATDEQTRMQQKMMKYMMILIGYAFYSVPSGLCLYIIASSLWGIAEKKLLPKPASKDGGLAAAPANRSAIAAEGNGAASRRNRKKQRGGK